MLYINIFYNKIYSVYVTRNVHEQKHYSNLWLQNVRAE